MKKKISLILAAVLTLTSLFALPVSAESLDAPKDDYEEMVHYDLKDGTSEVLKFSNELPEGDTGISLGSNGSMPAAIDPGARSIIGSDNRYTVQNVDQPPYRFVGRVVVAYYDGEVKQGTGFLVEKDVILTSANLLYNKKDGKAMEVFFTPAQNINSTVNPYPYSGTSGTDIYISKTYMDLIDQNKNPDIQYKYGIVKLSKPIGSATGFFTLMVHSSTENTLKGWDVTVAGYDQSWNFRKQPGTITYSKGGEMRYLIDTSKNQLGAPVYFTQSDYGIYYVAGINVEEGIDSGVTYNSGRVITEALYNAIQSMVNK